MAPKSPSVLRRLGGVSSLRLRLGGRCPLVVAVVMLCLSSRTRSFCGSLPLSLTLFPNPLANCRGAALATGGESG